MIFITVKMTVFMFLVDKMLTNIKEEGQRPSFQKRMTVWLAASKNGLSIPISFEPDETLTYENYIPVVLLHALAESRRLLGDDFIYATRFDSED